MKPDWLMSATLTAMIILTAIWLIVAVTFAVSEPEPEIGSALYCEQLLDGSVECGEPGQ